MEELEKEQIAADRASKGGAARMKGMSKKDRQELARSGAIARWAKGKAKAGISSAGQNSEYKPINLHVSDSETTKLPMARWPGILRLGTDIPCYVLDDGRRVVTRTAVTSILSDGKGGGNLEKYLIVEGLKDYLPDLQEQMIEFHIPGTSSPNTTTRGISAENFVDICRAYVNAHESGGLKTDRQKEIAMKAAMFLAGCAKVGLIAMIDEATGYQYERADNALQIKLKLFLAEEMRKWEKTFPDQLWEQFGRLTNWTGSIQSRPKYWGNLVMELVYEYLDADVAEWLRQNAPKPVKGQNYHQWMTQQYGLKKLIEHIWKLIGIASTCSDMKELKYRMEQLYGKRSGFQYQLRLVGPRLDSAM